MNNLNFINLKPYPVDMDGNREHVKVIPTVTFTQEVSAHTGLDWATHFLNCSRDTPSNNGLDARDVHETAFALLEENEEDYKTPTTIDTIYTQCPKRKSSREQLKQRK